MQQQRTKLAPRLWAEYVRQSHRLAVRLARKRAAEVHWQEHRATLERERQQLIESHMPLVDKIARQVYEKFTRAGQDGYHSRIELQDMVSCGYIGLVEAAGRYHPSRGSFAAFASFRVRGAMIDAHRRRAYREGLNDSVEAIEDRLGFLPAHVITDRGPLPDEIVARREQGRRAAASIARLPDDERTVLLASLAGEPLADTAAGCARSVAWARGKLAKARDQVAAELRRP